MPTNERIIASIRSNDPLIELSDEQKQSLLDCVGYDYYLDEQKIRDRNPYLSDDEIKTEVELHKKASQLLINTQCLLSFYSVGIENLDSAPTETATQQQFQSLHDVAETLYMMLMKISPHHRAELKNIKYDVPGLMQKLSEFTEVSNRIAKRPKSKDSRGSKKQVARQAIVNGLADNFDRFCGEGFTEESKEEFIKRALVFAGIPLPKRIRDLFYRPGDKRIIFKQLQ